MWDLDDKKDWVLKNWCLWTVVLKKTLESYLDSQEIKPVHPQGNQPLDFLGRDDAEAKLHYFGHLMQRANSLEKTLMLRKIEERRRRGWKMVGCHHQLNGHEYEQILGDGEEQGSLMCFSPWGCKESDTTEQLNNNNNLPWSDGLPSSSPVRMSYSWNIQYVWFFRLASFHNRHLSFLIFVGW